MAVVAFLFMLLLIGGSIVAASGGAAYAVNRNRIDAQELRAAKMEARIGSKALRSIASGAGNPILEAEIALDTINNNDIKEIN